MISCTIIHACGSYLMERESRRDPDVGDIRLMSRPRDQIRGCNGSGTDGGQPREILMRGSQCGPHSVGSASAIEWGKRNPHQSSLTIRDLWSCSRRLGGRGLVCCWGWRWRRRWALRHRRRRLVLSGLLRVGLSSWAERSGPRSLTEEVRLFGKSPLLDSLDSEDYTVSC